MTYFNAAFLNFLENLSKNNNTAWFNDNRKAYENEVKKPFANFVQEMINRIQKHEPEVRISPSDAIMRINKDIRFSKDKTPYNTHVSANISRFGKKDKSYPGFYFQLSSEGIMVYGGAYMIENPTLQNIRNYIADHLKDFSGAYGNKAFMEKFGKIQGEQSKRIPSEFQAAAAKEPLIANKQFYYSASISPDVITSSKLADVLTAYYLAGKAVNGFLKRAWAE